MQASFTVNIRDIAELRHLQKTITSLIAIETGVSADEAKPEAAPTPKPKAVTKPKEAPAPAPVVTEASTGAEQAAPAVEEVTAEQVTATTLALGKYGKRDEIKALLAKFGVERASQLKPEDRAAYVTEARKHLPVGG